MSFDAFFAFGYSPTLLSVLIIERRMKHYPTVLSIAGSDSSGGAGIQADIKTCTALGCYAMTAITALTAQNTIGVKGILHVSGFLKMQLEATLEDIRPDAVKIGMLPDAESVKETADAICKYRLENIIFDPVMAATSGTALSSSDAVVSMCDTLLPLTAVFTPNIPESEIFSGLKISDIDDMERAARIISQKYFVKAVLVKGGHLHGAGDLLYDKMSDSVMIFDGEFVDTHNTHGTGCTLSSAIACGLACGLSIVESIQNAKYFITAAIKYGTPYKTGHGHGPLNHMYNIINPIIWR